MRRPVALFTAVCLCLAAGFVAAAAEESVPTKTSHPLNPQGTQDIEEAPLTIDQVIALLQAKVGERVILRQIEATGTRLTMTVDTLLSLKAAGASDTLLEALQKETAPETPAATKARPAVAVPDVTATEGHPFRVFLMEDDSGGRVVHITNLDENGKRIGGEIPEDYRASRNVVTPPGYIQHDEYDSPPSGPREGSPSEPGGYAGGSAQQPVIVNVYNESPSPAPANDGTAIIGGSEPIGGDAFINTGIYPGYFNYGYGYSPVVYPTHGGIIGPRYGYGGVIYSPPGSYSHYVRYHRPYGAHYFKQAYPYNWGVPASRRNNYYFRTR